MPAADQRWEELQSDANVRVVKISAETHDAQGQQLLADPLSALAPHLEGDGWTLQLQVVNAHIPSGPLPLPDEVELDGFSWIWVIRKIIVIFLIFDDLRLVVAVAYRYDPEGELAREQVLDVLERSGEARGTS